MHCGRRGWGFKPLAPWSTEVRIWTSDLPCDREVSGSSARALRTLGSFSDDFLARGQLTAPVETGLTNMFWKQIRQPHED